MRRWLGDLCYLLTMGARNENKILAKAEERARAGSDRSVWRPELDLPLVVIVELVELV